ncbi:MAG: hypothetical protein ABSH08_22435 [Tepidisphaeraceae bacterium]|jgi:hypothetical protein
MFGLVKSLKDKETNDRIDRVRRYRELLEMGDSAAPKDVQELAALMAQLGFDASRAELHLRAISERKRLTDLSASCREAEAAQAAARREHEQFEATARKQIAELNQKLADLFEARTRADNRAFVAGRAAHSLHELERSYSELFGLNAADNAQGPAAGPRPA